MPIGSARFTTRQPGLTNAKVGLYTQIIASDPGGAIPLPKVRPNLGPGAALIELNRVTRQLTSYTEASVKLVVLETVEILVNTTPIDTTWAAHSWFPGFGGTESNGGYLIDPGDEDLSETAGSFDNFGGDDFEEDPADAFLRENDPEFGGGGGTASGEIVSIEHEFKLQERKANQASAVTKFASTRIFVNQYVARSPEISNNTPYIAELNEGTSKQTPRNFVGRAILAGLTKVELRTRFIGRGKVVRFI